MLKLDKIHRKIGNFSLNNINLEIEQGDYFMLLGNSGAGKTMLLEIIAGLVNPDSGQVYIANENITQTAIQKRGIGLVYQDQSLFPHLSVYDNIAYPLKSKGENKEQIKQQVERLAADTEVQHLLKRNPATLSGGEIQRVAIARTLASKPKVLLLDEPLSSLDVQLKKEMSALLRKINRKGQTIVHVTHDYEEAISLANKIGIIENNTIIQVGSPYEVFHHPQSKFVAHFIGIKNFYRGEIITEELQSSLKVFQTGNVQILISSDESKSLGHLIIPGESIAISSTKIESSAMNHFEGMIKEIIPVKLGIEIVIDIGIEISTQITKASLEKFNFETGQKIWLHFKASSLRFIRE